MKLTERVLEGLAEMVTGDNPLFPYRSSTYMTRFFERCGQPFVHNGSTRRIWMRERLTELNLGLSHAHDLPPDDLLRVITELLDPDDFDRHNNRSDMGPDRQVSVEAAMQDLNID